MAANQHQSLVASNYIPIIDMAHITASSVCPIKSCTRNAAQRLHSSLMEKGIALLVNHGIPEEKLNDINLQMELFCNLSNDIRSKYKVKPDDPQKHGYRPPGKENVDELSVYQMRHVYNVQFLEKNQLPEDEIPGISTAIKSLAEDFQSLAKVLLQFIAIGLGLCPQYFLQYHNDLMTKHNNSTMRLVYFPPVDDTHLKYTKSDERKDFGTFTIIAQNAEGGVEVKMGNKWTPVGFMSGALLIITGSLLEKWTDGQYKALGHKISIPEDVNVMTRARHSVMFFVHPHESSEIKPVEIKKQEGAVLKKNTSKLNTILHACHGFQRKFRDTYKS